MSYKRTTAHGNTKESEILEIIFAQTQFTYLIKEPYTIVFKGTLVHALYAVNHQFNTFV